MVDFKRFASMASKKQLARLITVDVHLFNGYVSWGLCPIAMVVTICEVKDV